MRRFVIFGLAFIALLAFVQPAFAEQPAVDVYFFWGDGCPHCAKEETFLQDLKKDLGDTINIHSHEVWYNEENQELLARMAEALGEEIGGVPATFVGDQLFIGFGSSATTGVEIRRAITALLQKAATVPDEQQVQLEDGEQPQEVAVPILGVIQPDKYSLPVLTMIIAAIDGFNPCAMWVLVLLIGMLIGMQDRKRLWILGGLFIFVSGLVYFVFLAAWLNVFKIIGAVRWIQGLVGLFALAAGFYYLRRFWTERSGECKVTNVEQKKKIMIRIQEIIHKRSLLLSAISIAVLAVMVNAIELACSAGLPAIFTQVLSLSSIPSWQHYAYLVLYIFIFMLDDMIVFSVAVTSLRAIGLSGKFSRIASLIGGLIIIILGIILLFDPGILMFG